MKYALMALMLPALVMTACGGSPNVAPSDDGAASSNDAPASTEAAGDAAGAGDATAKTADALGGYDLPETAEVAFAKPDVGSLTVGYPGGWLFFNDYFITPSEEVNMVDLQTGMPAGAAFIQINGDAAGAFNSDDVASYAESAFGPLASSEGLTFSDLETVPIAGEGIATVSKQTATKSDVYDTAFYILEAEGGEYITLMFYTAPGELASQQALMEAMVASVSYTAP